MAAHAVARIFKKCRAWIMKPWPLISSSCHRLILSCITYRNNRSIVFRRAHRSYVVNARSSVKIDIICRRRYSCLQCHASYVFVKARWSIGKLQANSSSYIGKSPGREVTAVLTNNVSAGRSNIIMKSISKWRVMVRLSLIAPCMSYVRNNKCI